MSFITLSSPRPREVGITFSICIYRVNHTIVEEDIFNVFNKINIGRIQCIDIINKINSRGEKYSEVLVHFNRLSDHDIIRHLTEGWSANIRYNTGDKKGVWTMWKTARRAP